MTNHEPAAVDISTDIELEKSDDETSSKVNDAATEEIYAEGETVHVGYTSYTVWRSWWSYRLSDNEFVNYRPDAMFLIVELTVRNNDSKARIIPPFTLIDDGEAEYETSSKAWAMEGSLGVIDSLNPSVSKQGLIVFDVPPQNRNYRLKLSGGYWSLEDAYVRILPKESKEAALRGEQDRKDQAAELRKAEIRHREAIETAKWRTWSDATGKFKTEAIYGGTVDGKVELINKKGKSIRIPIEKLSIEDQAWIGVRLWNEQPAE